MVVEEIHPATEVAEVVNRVSVVPIRVIPLLLSRVVAVVVVEQEMPVAQMVAPEARLVQQQGPQAETAQALLRLLEAEGAARKVQVVQLVPQLVRATPVRDSSVAILMEAKALMVVRLVPVHGELPETMAEAS
jgi:hypothetical protein